MSSLEPMRVWQAVLSQVHNWANTQDSSRCPVTMNACIPSPSAGHMPIKQANACRVAEQGGVVHCMHDACMDVHWDVFIFPWAKDICQTLRLWFTFIHICTHIQSFLCFRIKKENVFCKKKICYLSATKMKIYSPLLLLLLLPTLSILFWSSYHHLYRLPRPLPPPHRLVIALVLPRAKPPTTTQSWWRLFFLMK